MFDMVEIEQQIVVFVKKEVDLYVQEGKVKFVFEKVQVDFVVIFVKVKVDVEKEKQCFVEVEEVFEMECILFK